MFEKVKSFTIIAGPNGAGKTTFVRDIFPDLLQNSSFINADFFAQEMAPENVGSVAISAGKKFLKEIDRFIKENESLVIEKTLSGMNLLKKIKEAKQKGFFIRFIFLWVTSPELCDFRVKARVALGGHNIPFENTVRRYRRGLANFTQYIQVSDEGKIFLADEFRTLIYNKYNQKIDKILAPDLYNSFQIALKNL